MPADLKRRIKIMADAEDRTMAKWCAMKLKEIVEGLEAQSARTPLKSIPPPARRRPQKKA